MTRLFATVVACLAVALAVSTPSLAATSGGGSEQVATADQTSSTRPIAADPTSALEYRLGAADKVRVIVYGEEDLSGEFFVSGAGKVSLPLIGEVQAAGLSVRAFQDEVQNALKDGYLKDPKVSVEVLTFRPYYIMGEVMKPGQYPYTDELTVQNAVATAGGFTYRANKGKVFIKRLGQNEEHSYPLTSSTTVAPGDTIRIGERLF